MLLDVLAVVPLGAGQAEQALLEDRIAPFHSASAKQRRPWRSQMPEQAVLAPAVGAAARVVVREVVPARRRPPSSPRAPSPTAAPTRYGPNRFQSRKRRWSSSSRRSSAPVVSVIWLGAHGAAQS